MPADRFYTSAALFSGAHVRLAKEEELHMRKVMRKSAGDTVQIFNGQGVLYAGEVAADGSLRVKDLLQEELKGPEIIIAQALISPNKLDWVTEKCAELGAASLWLFPADRSEKKQVSDTLLTRLHTIAISSAKQSGRLYLMNIALKPPLKEWASSDNVYFGSTLSEAKTLDTLPESFIFAIGPEKGFSEKEHALFPQNHGITLSSYTLRTETAALVLLAKLAGP